jgi:hypothetical protein
MQNFLFLFFFFSLGPDVVGLEIGPRLGWLHSGLGQSPWPSRTALFLSFLFSFLLNQLRILKIIQNYRKIKKYQTSFFTLALTRATE